MSRVLNFTEHDFEQRSPEWYAVRLGKVTSSRASLMLAKLKKGEAAGRRNLRVGLVVDRLTGKSQEGTYLSRAMQDGIDREDAALAAYEAETGNLVERSGFLQHNELMAGASLDAQVNNFVVMVEAKSPLPATHLGYLRSGKVPHDYLCQVTHQLYITGAEWCDWYSFHPDFPENLRGKLVRVTRDDVDLVAYDTALRAFLAEVDVEVQAVRTMAGGAEAA
ncbi:hypothetical protein LCGC14_2917370 [marine sediment metagenome]|uniref:YqaJ viral recombinase domain-containing protein n=1 Tax=marine sediment metagenome TaxID=412755 RepID=A0A0F8XQ18_9ZZZZ